MNRVYILLAAVLVFFALLVFVPTALDRFDVKVKLPRMGKWYSQVLTEEAVINKHGVYGVDFVRCRRCSVEKLRKGPLTFGGLNTLVLEGLEVVLPPETSEVTATGSSTPKEIVGRMGMDDGFFRAQGASRKFSALRVEDLTVSLLHGTNVVRAFSAAHGEAKQDGLHLRDCVIMRETTNRVPRALLKVKPSVRLEWAGDAWDLK